MKKTNKRHFLLLEVLIAFTLVVLCLFPLLTPHIAMRESQGRFMNKIEMDHTASLIYADVIEKLYLRDNGIHWSDIASNKEFTIDEKGLPFTAIYQLEVDDKKKKENPQEGRTVYLLKLKIVLSSNIHPEDVLNYEYRIPYERHAKGETQFPKENEE